MDQILKIGLPAMPSGRFNPFDARTVYDMYSIAFVYQSMLYVNAQQELGPRLIQHWQKNAELEYELELHPAIRWHDGAPVTVEDVIFTIQMAARLPIGKSYRFEVIRGMSEFVRGEASTVQGFEPLSPHRLRIHLQTPDEQFWFNFLLVMVPAHLFRDCSPEAFADHPLHEKPIGCGPYIYQGRSAEGHFVYCSNGDYFLRAPLIPQLRLQKVEPEETENLLSTGQIDFCYVQPDQIEIAKQHYHVFSFPSLVIQVLNFNHRHHALQHLEVRQALAGLLDVKSFVARHLGEHAVVLRGYYPPLVEFYRPDALPPRHEDPEWSQDILQKHQVHELKVACLEGNAIRQGFLEELKERFSCAGVQLQVTFLNSQAFLETVLDRPEYDMWVVGWTLGLSGDPSAYMDAGSFHMKALGWENLQKDQLLARIRNTHSREELEVLYRDLELLVCQQLPFVPLYTQNEIQVAHRRILHLKPDPRGAIWNVHELELCPQEVQAE